MKKIKEEILEKSGISLFEETVEKMNLKFLQSQEQNDVLNVKLEISFEVKSLSAEEIKQMIKKEGTMQRFYEAALNSVEAYKKFK